jgi:hypothetical protein
MTAPRPPEPKPVEKSGESLEERALAYFKEVNPLLADEEYYTKHPERSMTYKAALWGLSKGREAGMREMEESEKLHLQNSAGKWELIQELRAKLSRMTEALEWIADENSIAQQLGDSGKTRYATRDDLRSVAREVLESRAAAVRGE